MTGLNGTVCALARATRSFAQLSFNQTDHGRDDRHGDDADNQQLKVLLHKGDAAKEVAQQSEDRRPGNAAQHVKDDKVAPMHAAHAGDEGHKGADKREEATQEDGQVAPFVQEVLGFLMRSGVMALTLPEAMIFWPKK